MPTERFKRLPEEKIEAIRRAGIQEFTRTSPESASINRIIQEADISRGSFYTYFESKYDLLRWLISDRVREHNDFYVQDMEENGGDIWLTLSRSAWSFPAMRPCGPNAAVRSVRAATANIQGTAGANIPQGSLCCWKSI